MEDIKHHLVNWSDGMNINKSHFVGMENALIDQIRDAQQVQITDFNYGILPNRKGKKSPEVSVILDGQNKLIVKLLDCNAVTLGGSRININENTIPLLATSQNLSSELQLSDTSDKNIYVVISIDIFDKVPIGSADPTENPPRKPNAIPSFKLNLVSESDLKSGELGYHHLSIGLITIQDGNAVLSSSYIPPSACINSHSELVLFHDGLVRFLYNLESNCIRIIQKVFQKEQKNYLAQIVQDLAEQLISFTSESSTNFRTVLLDKAPIYTVNKLVSIARLMKNRIDMRQGTGKEELLNYLSDWCGLNQATFEKMLDELITNDYEHFNIRNSVVRVKHFTDMTDSLFQKLAELDYIGKRNETNIFVKEETITTKSDGAGPAWKGRFLAD